MTDRDQSGTRWPAAKLQRIRPVEDGTGTADTRYEEPGDLPRQPAHVFLTAALAELRRRWRSAFCVGALFVVPVLAYAVFAVPTYTAEGAVQVSSQSAVNPLLELVGTGPGSDVQTEVEIIRRREFVLSVLKNLKLHVVDPHQPSWVTSNLGVALGGSSPVREELRRVRSAASQIELRSGVLEALDLVVGVNEEELIELEIGAGSVARRYELAPGEELSDTQVVIVFRELPLGPGQKVHLAVLPDGMLLESAMTRLSVASLGNVRQVTNLVEIRFTDPDRVTAQSVVNGIMSRYLDLALRWQTVSASNAAEFIAERLQDAQDKLSSSEETLRQFAERERTVKLDTQAEVTIESAAELEAEKRKVELQERVIDSVAASMKRRSASESANLTANFFEDPVLAANVAALTQAETELAVLKATLTPEHPQIKAMSDQIVLRRKEVNRLLRSAQKNLAQQRRELDARLEKAMSSLSEYPDKELQLARHMRDVEVNQRLYSFLLEKYQEARIMEASTTIDKRIVDAADLPFRRASPARGRLLVFGVLGGVLAGFLAIYLAHLFQRRLETVEAVKEALPFPVYGTIPVAANGSVKKAKTGVGEAQLRPADVWAENHGPIAEAFRGLAVNVSLSPAAPGRGRIVQLTSSQASEGKSTVISNLAVALTMGGARVLVLDLDLRKPVQHRVWGLRRSPGYSDLIARGEGPKQAVAAVQREEASGVDLLTAGTKLPDTLRVLMSSNLEAMLAYWSERYDFVLVDSPPAFVADTTVVGRHADLILVVGRPGVVERGHVRQSVEALERLDVPKGLVLSAVERKHAEYYYGNAYYYQAAYGQAAEDEDQQAAS